ncbi:MAG: hypothetical protein AUI36_45550 [Cyanobacteria bacterium 13_1_40CM_2_61_4]|nr:MAG: hypothetical protein AUI36_45550 [Cyanobacteria bacterium 13_1_40CM_2_61_4]
MIFKIRTAVTTSTLLDMLLWRQGTPTMTTGDKAGIGKRMFLLSGLMQPLECGLGSVKQLL